jgi:integrase
MARWPMLIRRGTIWYYRRSIPLALRPLLKGKGQVWKSLRTSDYDEAKLLSLRVGQEVERELQALRKRATSLQTDPESLARLHESSALSADAEWRRSAAGRTSYATVNGDMDPEEDEARRHSERLDAELDALTSAVDDHAEALRLNDTGIIAGLLDEVLQEQGLYVPPQRRRDFAMALLRARLRSLEVGVKRTKAERQGERLQDQGVTVDGLLETYLTERKLGSKSEHEVRAAYRRFAAIVGAFKPSREVSKADCRAYKESLLAAPSNRSLSKDGKLSAKSVKKLMGIVATIFRYGVGQGLLDTNPFEGITRVVRGGHGNHGERRLPYDAADLEAIFRSEGFEKFTGAKRWLPLIALYTGGRVEEIAGLRAVDLRESEGVRYFDFIPYDARGLKTPSSRRRVPVHSELVRRGLLDYAATVPRGGLLFPELKPGPHGKLADAFSKWWARYTDGLGITDPYKTFHSFRHGFKDACRRAGTSEEVHDALTGHAGASVGRSYGSGVPLPALAEAMARIHFDAIERRA